MEIGAESQREPYLAKLQQWLTETEKDILNHQIAYNQFITDEPLDKALRAFLKNRLMVR